MTLYLLRHRQIWNAHIEKLINRYIPISEDIILIIPGSESGSDLSTSNMNISIVKNKLKDFLLRTQKFDSNTQTG